MRGILQRSEESGNEKLVTMKRDGRTMQPTAWRGLETHVGTASTKNWSIKSNQIKNCPKSRWGVGEVQHEGIWGQERFFHKILKLLRNSRGDVWNKTWGWRNGPCVGEVFQKGRWEADSEERRLKGPHFCEKGKQRQWVCWSWMWGPGNGTRWCVVARLPHWCFSREPEAEDYGARVRKKTRCKVEKDAHEWLVSVSEWWSWACEVSQSLNGYIRTGSNLWEVGAEGRSVDHGDSAI